MFENNIAQVEILKAFRRYTWQALNARMRYHHGQGYGAVYTGEKKYNRTTKWADTEEAKAEMDLATRDRLQPASSVASIIPPATERVWMAIPNLTTTGSAVSGGGTAVTVSGIGESTGEVCNEFTYNTAMFDYMGEWQLEITDLVGMGDSGTDQQRVVGSWIFEFVMP